MNATGERRVSEGADGKKGEEKKGTVWRQEKALAALIRLERGGKKVLAPRLIRP